MTQQISLLPKEVRERLKELSKTDPAEKPGDSMVRTILLDEYIDKIKREYPQHFRRDSQ